VTGLAPDLAPRGAPTQRPTAAPSAQPSPPLSVGLGAWLPETAAFALDLARIALPDRPDQSAPVLVIGGRADGGETEIRLIGALQADHTEGGLTVRNDCMVAAARDDARFGAVREIDELGVDVLASLMQAWEAYNAARCAAFQVVAIGRAREAGRLFGDRCDHEVRLDRGPAA
jgi:hypothetical protein